MTLRRAQGLRLAWISRRVLSLRPGRRSIDAAPTRGNKMARFTALIVGGDRLFREGLEQLLRPTSFTVIGSAKSLLQILPGPECPDLIVLGFDHETSVEEEFKSLSCIRIVSPAPRVVVLTCLP